MANGFWEMVQFDLRLRARSATTYIFWIVLFLISLTPMVIDESIGSNGIGGVNRNAETFLGMFATGMVAFFATMISAIAGTGIYRDFESNTHELFFSTRLNKAGYWYGRFTGSFLVVLAVFSAIPLAFMFGSTIPGKSHALMGPFRWDTYTALCTHLLLPDLFLLAALFFVVGALTRSLLAIYTQGIAMLVLVAIAGAISNLLNNRDLASLIEPFGLASFGFVTRYWTIYEENTQTVPLTGVFLQNRLIWMGIALVVLVGGYYIFDFAHSPRTLRRRKQDTPPPQDTAYTALEVTAAPTGWRYQAAAYGQLVRLYALEIIRGVPFIVIMLCGVLWAILAASQAGKIYDTPVYPVTRIILQAITGNFAYFFYALIMFYSGELVWRERVLRNDQVSDSLPVSTPVTVAAKISAVLAMIAAINFVLILTGIGVQLAQGFFHIDLPLYLRWVYGIEFWDYILITFLVFFLHTALNNKFLGHSALVIYFIATWFFKEYFSRRHVLYYSERPGFIYSDMNGFGPFLTAIRWHQFYWLAGGVLLVLLALKLTVRGTDTRWKSRWNATRLGSAARIVGGLAAVAFVGAGAWIVYNTDYRNTYINDENRHAAQYEKRYKKKYDNVPQPRIIGVKLDISLQPERGQYSLRGTYRLRNKTKKPIREIILDINQDLAINRFTWSVPARPNLVDTVYGFRTFTLDKPLAPGAEMTFGFDVADRRTGFTNDGGSTKITENGTFLTLPAPRIGYQPSSELSDPGEREKYGLPERRIMAPASDIAARSVTYIGNDADWIAFDATVRTAPDQIALAPGYLQKEWNEKGRHCFQYHMDAPIRDFYSILSARYKVKTDTWTAPDGKKVALAVYYHPEHYYNINRMLSGVKASLTYCSANYSPYQFRQLRILEFPAYATFAQSFPNTIPYSEGFGFIARVSAKKDDLDYPFYVSAHETAHQWWAHQVIGGNVEGSEMLSESLSEYSALMVFKHRYGNSYLRRLLRYDMDEYLKGRGEDTFGENPLVKAQHQQYIHYDKGSLVFCALAARIGEERLDTILARFVRDKKFQDPPYTTAAELVGYLKDGASDDEKAFIHDLFERITIYDCHADKATRKKLPDGKWQVKLSYTIKKYDVDPKGKETLVPMNGEVFDIGVFKEGKGKKPSHGLNIGDSLSVEMLPIYKEYPGKKPTSIQAEKTFIYAGAKPIYAGIDPYNVMIDRNTDDNVVEIRDEK